MVSPARWHSAQEYERSYWEALARRDDLSAPERRARIKGLGISEFVVSAMAQLTRAG